MIHEPDSHRFDTHAAEVYYGFASDVRPEREYDHDDDPDFGNRVERSKSSEWMAAMDTGDMELAASLFGEMTDAEQREAQNEYAAARSALDRLADVDAAATGDGDGRKGDENESR